LGWFLWFFCWESQSSLDFTSLKILNNSAQTIYPSAVTYFIYGALVNQLN
jgi:hypothetical protein